MELARHPASRGHERLTVAAAALAVLAVLVAPPSLAGLLDLVAPPHDPLPPLPLTERARQVAELPGATVLQDSVILTLTPQMRAPVMGPAQRVEPKDSVGQLVPLGVSGLLPMDPHLAPIGSGALMADLWPGDKVFANLGPLVASCLPRPTGPSGECTPTLLTQHATGYYRFPGAWGTATFLDDGTRMQAEIVDVLGARVVAGGRPGSDTDHVMVSLSDGSSVSAFTTMSASPGDTVWWATVHGRPVQATAYDADGNALETLDLDG
jgi:hypothetical protein